MALIAGLDHLVALTLPVFLGQAGDIGGFNYVDKFGGLALRVKYAERLQDRRAISSPLLVFRQRQPTGEECPGGSHFVIALLHVAGLTSWGSGTCRKDVLLL